MFMIAVVECYVLRIKCCCEIVAVLLHCYEMLLPCDVAGALL